MPKQRLVYLSTCLLVSKTKAPTKHVLRDTVAADSRPEALASASFAFPTSPAAPYALACWIPKLVHQELLRQPETSLEFAAKSIKRQVKKKIERGSLNGGTELQHKICCTNSNINQNLPKEGLKFEKPMQVNLERNIGTYQNSPCKRNPTPFQHTSLCNLHHCVHPTTLIIYNDTVHAAPSLRTSPAQIPHNMQAASE